MAQIKRCDGSSVIQQSSQFWITCEPSEYNPRLISRRQLFFSSTFGVLSPIFGSCHQFANATFVSSDAFDSVANYLRGKKMTISFGDSSFQVVDLNKARWRKRISEIWESTRLKACRRKPDVLFYHTKDRNLAESLRAKDLSASASGDFVVKQVGSVEETAFSRLEEIERQEGNDNNSQPELHLTHDEASFVSDPLIMSRLSDSHCVLIPDFYLMTDTVKDQRGKLIRRIYSLSPYCILGDLDGFSSKGKLLCGLDPSLREAVLAKIIQNSLEGLKILHEKGYVHGDYKLSNVVVCRDPSSDVGYTTKLIDFEHSSLVEDKLSPNLDRSRFGTRAYLGPEFIDGLKTKSLDIWAVGASLFQLITGQPFRSLKFTSEISKLVLKNRMGWTTEDDARALALNMSPELSRLLQQLLNVDPSKRPSCEQILKSDWMAKCERTILKEKAKPNSILESIKNSQEAKISKPTSENLECENDESLKNPHCSRGLDSAKESYMKKRGETSKYDRRGKKICPNRN